VLEILKLREVKFYWSQCNFNNKQSKSDEIVMTLLDISGIICFLILTL
jgi:hypothetical protein